MSEFPLKVFTTFHATPLAWWSFWLLCNLLEDQKDVHLVGHEEHDSKSVC
jgi:hypothetical protein